MKKGLFLSMLYVGFFLAGDKKIDESRCIIEVINKPYFKNSQEKKDFIKKIFDKVALKMEERKKLLKKATGTK